MSLASAKLPWPWPHRTGLLAHWKLVGVVRYVDPVTGAPLDGTTHSTLDDPEVSGLAIVVDNEKAGYWSTLFEANVDRFGLIPPEMGEDEFQAFVVTMQAIIDAHNAEVDSANRGLMNVVHDQIEVDLKYLMDPKNRNAVSQMLASSMAGFQLDDFSTMAPLKPTVEGPKTWGPAKWFNERDLLAQVKDVIGAERRLLQAIVDSDGSAESIAAAKAWLTCNGRKATPNPQTATAAAEIVAQMNDSQAATFNRHAWRDGISAMLVGEWASLDLFDVLGEVNKLAVERTMATLRDRLEREGHRTPLDIVARVGNYQVDDIDFDDFMDDTIAYNVVVGLFS